MSKISDKFLSKVTDESVSKVTDGFLSKVIDEELDISALSQISPRQIGPLKKSALGKSAPYKFSTWQIGPELQTFI